jgi:hypothetical protein
MMNITHNTMLARCDGIVVGAILAEAISIHPSEDVQQENNA